MSNHRHDIKLGDIEVAIINGCMSDLEEILGATIWAVVATDGTGTFLFPRPDSERPVIDYLASVDWRTAQRIVQEHSS